MKVSTIHIIITMPQGIKKNQSKVLRKDMTLAGGTGISRRRGRVLRGPIAKAG